MADWPDYVSVQADGYETGSDPDVARDAFEDGLVRQEKLYTAAMRTRTIVGVILSDAEKEQFRAWVAASGHTWFGWHDPEDGIRRLARIRNGSGGVTYRARVRAGKRTWEIRAVIEG